MNKTLKRTMLYPVQAGVFLVVGSCVVLGLTVVLLAGAFQALSDEN